MQSDPSIAHLLYAWDALVSESVKPLVGRLDFKDNRIESMTIDLAIIPARAGSVGLTGKNIADLGGAPLIAWTVRAALASGCFKRVIVSTDGPEIAEAARAAGAQVPFMRPAKLATSHARSNDVILHALGAMESAQTFAMMQPTSPFRAARHIVEAVRQFDASPSNPALISVAKGKPAAWLFSRTEDGRLQALQGRDGAAVYRRQDAQATFAPNGAIYLCQADVFRARNTLFPEGLIGYPMGEIDSLDIDDAEDMALARAIVAADLRRMDP